MPHKDPIARAAYYKQWRIKNADHTRAVHAAWREKNKEHVKRCLRIHAYRRRYGITIEDYDRMFASQGGCCAICKTTEARGKGRFHVDHDHKTGKVRGVLCHLCNTSLGRMERYNVWTEYLRKES